MSLTKTTFHPMRALLYLSVIILFPVFMACGESGTEKESCEVADSFATAYFNWNYKKALKYTHPASRKWVVYAATQVKQEDVDILRGMDEPTAIEITDYTRDEKNDSLMHVTVRINNFLTMDTIGTSGHIMKEGEFVLALVCIKGKWLVKLDELPRPLK